MTLVVGSHLGPYEVVGPLRAGGMGEVYRARDPRLGREVAIKVLPSAVANDPERLRRFEQEARAVSALNHPNILTIHDVGSEGGVSYLVTELLRGESLRDGLANGALPPRRAAEIGVQIARGLAAAHEQGIIHRDLKPENLFLTRDGIAKILDFGLARRDAAGPGSGEVTTLAGGTAAGTVLGTVGYMAPEQVRGEHTDARSDLFAFGCVLHEMLAGQAPFRRDTPVESLHAILHSQPDPPSASGAPSPPALESIVRRCLEKVPDRRFQTASDLAFALEQVLGSATGAPAESFSSGLSPRAAAPRPFRFGRLAAGLVLFVMATLAVLFALDAGGLRSNLRGGAGETIDSLAVLPLANFSNDPGQEFFADGMTEALIAELAKIRALKVISRTSVMQYKGAKQPLPEIARALGVRGVIEGSVARESGSVRITVQLIDAAEDRHLWAQSYTREEKDVLRLQGEMASAIAREIRIAVSPAEAEALASALPVDPEAHMLLLQARELDRRGSTQREQQQRVTELVDRALALAPGFAAAHAFRGAQIRALATTGYEAATETCPKARAELATALELDPRSVPAQNLDAELRAQCDFDWSGALEVYRNTLEVAPGDALLHGDYAGILSLVGRAEEAIEHSRRAAELDPLNDWIAGRRIAVLIPARRFDEAIAIGRKSLQLAPGSVYLKWQLANALFASGDRAAALDTYLSREVAHPGMNFMVGLLHGVDGRRAEAREVLDFLLERRRQRYVPGSQIGVVCAGMGELDQAFEWLERAYAERDVFLHGIAVDPIFDRVRRDPRGAALVARMGLPAPPR